MTTSMNGWEASPDPELIGIVPLQVAGVTFYGGVKGGDVATVLGYVLQQVAVRVQAPVHGQCGGYAYRPNVNNPGVLSNHSSGTAVDFNWAMHPNAVATVDTWSDEQINEIHAILAEVGGAVRWGGDYNSTPDAMHFEINVDAYKLAQVALALGSGGTPPPVGGAGVKGADAIEDAPVLWGSYSAPTPSAGLTSDAVDDEWSLVQTAWWKIVVPGDHDANQPIRVTAEPTTDPDGNYPNLGFILWTDDATAESRVVWERIFGTYSDVYLSPGDVVYIEVGQWAGSEVDCTYKVGVGSVTNTYGPWIQGDSFLMEPWGISQINTRTRWQNSNTEGAASALGGMSSAAGNVNELRQWSWHAMPDSGGNFMVRAQARADSAATGVEPWTGFADVREQGLMVYPVNKESRINYYPERPASAVGTQFESETYKTTKLRVVLPITGGDVDFTSDTPTSAVVAIKYAAADTGEAPPYDVVHSADERSWSAELLQVTTNVEFETTDLGEDGGVQVWPELILNNMGWNLNGPYSGGVNGGDSVSYNAFGGCYIALDRLITVQPTVQPPRHRFKYQTIEISSTSPEPTQHDGYPLDLDLSITGVLRDGGARFL